MTHAVWRNTNHGHHMTMRDMGDGRHTDPRGWCRSVYAWHQDGWEWLREATASEAAAYDAAPRDRYVWQPRKDWGAWVKEAGS